MEWAADDAPAIEEAVLEAMVIRDQEAFARFDFCDLVRIYISPFNLAENNIADPVIRGLAEG